jgi:hypothetical protein
MTAGIGGVALRMINGGCILCCVRSKEEPSGIVVAVMTSPVRGFALV